MKKGNVKKVILGVTLIVTIITTVVAIIIGKIPQITKTKI